VRDTLGADTNIGRRDVAAVDQRVSWGFAGIFAGWQQSEETSTGEEFADMFLGWNYNQWAPIEDEYYDMGQYRSDFMERNMAPWIALVIDRERRKAQ
jgi:hypothetical protein